MPPFSSRTRLRFIEPQLASSVDKPPEGKHWIHEIKHDGYRCQVLLERGQARVFTRNGYDWSDRYPSIVRAAAKVRCQSAIIDGEAIVQNGDGASDFEALSSAMRRQPHSIILYGFDLLHLDGKPLFRQCCSRLSLESSSITGTGAWRFRFRRLQNLRTSADLSHRTENETHREQLSFCEVSNIKPKKEILACISMF
jgi:hypothetical protein